MSASAAVGIRTIWERVPDWRDDVTLYSKRLTQSERALLIRNNLAVRFLEQGRYAEGIDVLEKVVELRLTTPQTWHNLGLLRAAAWLDERAPRPHQYLANVAALRGDWELALAEERAALARAPHSKLYRRNVETLEKKLQGDTKHE